MFFLSPQPIKPTIYPQTSSKFIVCKHCLYPPNFLSPGGVKKPTELQAGLGQNAAVLALPARRAECERKARLELQTKLEAPGGFDVKIVTWTLKGPDEKSGNLESQFSGW